MDRWAEKGLAYNFKLDDKDEQRLEGDAGVNHVNIVGRKIPEETVTNAKVLRQKLLFM